MQKSLEWQGLRACVTVCDSACLGGHSIVASWLVGWRVSAEHVSIAASDENERNHQLCCSHCMQFCMSGVPQGLLGPLVYVMTSIKQVC